MSASLFLYNFPWHVFADSSDDQPLAELEKAVANLKVEDLDVGFMPHAVGSRDHATSRLTMITVPNWWAEGAPFSLWSQRSSHVTAECAVTHPLPTTAVQATSQPGKSDPGPLILLAGWQSRLGHVILVFLSRGPGSSVPFCPPVSR